MRAFSILLLSASLAACASSPASRTRAPAPTTSVRVENLSVTNMTIYVVNAGQRTRIGSVNAKSTAQLRVPAAFTRPGSQIQFWAEPIIAGDRGVLSEPFIMQPGAAIEFRIPPG